METAAHPFPQPVRRRLLHHRLIKPWHRDEIWLRPRDAVMLMAEVLSQVDIASFISE